MIGAASTMIDGAPAASFGTAGLQGTLSEWLPEWATFPGWRWLAAAAIIAFGVYLSKFLVRLLGRQIARRFRRQSVAQTILRGIRLFTILLAVFVALSVLGLRLGNIVLSVTVFSAVLGVILAPLVGSFVGGLFILADQPYEIGDMIELNDGTRGFVDDITIRYTKVFTLDNTFLVLSNAAMRERDVTNFSAEDERTRLSVGLLVTYESDVEAARELLERAATNCEGVIEGGPDIRIGSARYPAKPTCYVDEYADDGVLLTLRYWADRPYKLLTMRSRVQTEFRRLSAEADADVELAYPHRHHVFDETSGSAQVTVERSGADSVPDADGTPRPTRSNGPESGKSESERRETNGSAALRRGDETNDE